MAQANASRAPEMHHALYIISALIFLCAIFYAGRKFDAIRYHLMARLNPPELEKAVDKFPGVSAEELIETALAAERRGDWQDSADRFLAAKRKNLALSGILFRVGKSAFDHGDVASADKAFEQAIRFGENLPVANYYRGLIAVQRHELPAALHFFEAATNAEPFLADLYYYWGEALRLDQHPREAIRRYQQAVERTPHSQDATLCQFKIRLARIEAVEGSKVSEELEQMRQAGPLSVDWLMTDAALQLQAGKISEAAQLIAQAKEKGQTGLFVTCAGDTIFLKAAEAHPEIAAARTVVPAGSPVPNESFKSP
jgi:tetratricopeptide (TPR) repeat protein